MPWDYAYQAGPPAALADLSDYCTKVRIIGEPVAGKRGSNPIVQYRHGEQASIRKFTRAQNFILETHLRYTDASGVVTDPDGKSGEVYRNKAAVARLLRGQAGYLARLQRDAPHQGVQYLDIEVLGDAMPTQFRHVYGWPIHASRPFWKGAAVTGQVTPFTVAAGDAPVGSLILDFTGAGTDSKLTRDDTGDFVQILGALPAGGVRVNVEEGTAVRITGGTDYANNLRMSTAFELYPGTNATTITGGPTITADWITQWT